MVNLPTPDFGPDKKYGDDGDLYQELVGRLMAMPREQGCEKKRKRRCDLEFYIETEQRPRGGEWKAGGINAPGTPVLYSFLIADTGVTIPFPTEILREAVRRRLGRDAKESDGDNPTRGRCVDLQTLLALAQKLSGMRIVRATAQPPREAQEATA